MAESGPEVSAPASAAGVGKTEAVEPVVTPSLDERSTTSGWLPHPKSNIPKIIGPMTLTQRLNIRATNCRRRSVNQLCADGRVSGQGSFGSPRTVGVCGTSQRVAGKCRPLGLHPVRRTVCQRSASRWGVHLR